MSFGIIIRGKNQPSQSAHFRPHYNNATGKYYGNKSDYLSDVKKMDLVPYKKPAEKEEPKYVASKWAHDMVRSAKESGVGSVWLNEIKKKGVDVDAMAKRQESANKLAKENNGSGFHNGELK